MDKRLRIAGIVGAIAFSIIILTSPSDPLPLPEPSTTQLGSDSAAVLASNLDEPRYIAFGDGSVFITEKTGAIRIVQDGILLETPLAVFRTADVFAGGLLGIATHPEFDQNRLIYVYHTYEEDDKLWNKILQIKEKDGRLDDAKIILDGIPGSPFLNGGVLKFGPDGKLYAGTGAVSDSLHLSQNITSLAGKILRINDDGTIPDNNPFPGSPVYSLGHRDVRGMAWSLEGTMYASEAGPSKNDEINMIEPGLNYGWPDVQCGNAAACFDPAIEPGGIAIYSGDILPLKGMMVVSSLRTSNLYEVDIIKGDIERSVLGGLGRIRDVAEGPDGLVYILTSNTDGKGFPDALDDKLVRIEK